MSARVVGQRDALVSRRDGLRDALVRRLADHERSGTQPTPEELRAIDNVKKLDAQVRYLDGEVERAGLDNPLLERVRGGESRKRSHMANHSNLTYHKHSRNSWLRDMVTMAVGQGDTFEARGRLNTHADEVAHDAAYLEYRDISRVDGSGGYGVPPAWLMDQYLELARPGRAFANLCQRQPLPGGTDSINIPKLLTGTAVGVQTADNQAVTDVDLTDTFINAPVRTISGQQGVAIQLLDQSPIAFDEIVVRDLIAAHAAVTDQQVLAGTGSSGQLLGVNLTPGINTVEVSSVTVAGVYSAIANAIQTIHTTRFLPPEVIVMHPRRWGWLLAQLDNQDRPLFVPNAQGPFNAAGILTAVDSQQIVGQMHGLPIVTDPNITITNGSETPTGDEDIIYVLRASDLVLWESGIRVRVLPETKASNLTVLLQIFSYCAFSAARYPQSIVEIVGLSAPTW